MISVKSTPFLSLGHYLKHGKSCTLAMHSVQLPKAHSMNIKLQEVLTVLRNAFQQLNTSVLIIT